MERRQLLSIAVLLLVLGMTILLPNSPPLPGDRTTGRMLLDQGVRHEDLPLWGLGIQPKRLPDSLSLEVRLADAVHLPQAKDRWKALQRLAKEFPDSLAVHATITRYAYSGQGGSVRVGRSAEIERLLPPPVRTPIGPPAATGSAPMGGSTKMDGYEPLAGLPTPALAKPPRIEPNDIRLMLASCAVGERLDPENGYFPALAAIAYAAVHRDAEARAALHRAGQKAQWDERMEGELQGLEQRAQMLNATGDSSGKITRMSGLVYPQESQLLALARLAIVWAMDSETKGDIAQGLTLRRDVARLGRLMQTRSPWNITSLVGNVIENHAAKRPGGAPALSGERAGQRTQIRFAAYLRQHGKPGEGDTWERDFQHRIERRDKSKALSSFSPMQAMPETHLRALTSLVLMTAVVLLTLVGGLAQVLARFGTRSAFLSVSVFLFLLSGFVWVTLGTATDHQSAFGMLQQGCSCGSPEQEPDDGSEPAPPAISTPFNYSPEALTREYGLMLLVPSALALWGVLILVLGNRAGKSSRGSLFRATALPLAAMFGLLYGIDSISFSLREQTLQRELNQLRRNESQYLAEKLKQVRITPQP